MANGFNYASSHEWSNLGQGAPEVGEIPDAPPRPNTLPMPIDSLEYAPTTGVKGTCTHYYISARGKRLKSSIALRTAVADLYNHTYRQGKASQYNAENVCIVPGGRAGLSRVAAVIGDVYTVSLCVVRDPRRVLMTYFLQSYQIPDYTAYDQVLSAFKRLVPVPTA